MDARIEQIFREEMRGDTSFQEKDNLLLLLFGKNKYTKQQMRETWHSGIRHGIEIGLRKASLEGQRLELHNNTQNPKHKEFLDKFCALTDEYKCAVQYHPEIGMVIIER